MSTPAQIEALRPHPIIRHWMGSNVHCAARPLSAVRQVVGNYWPGPKFRQMTREQRRFAIASVIQVQRENQAEYYGVLSGKFRERPVNPYVFHSETKAVTVEKGTP